ncbi:PIF1 [Mytilus coruscus]|uniref:PIF1 n=1 Tax=Mytilus coruscus TaxID=42192 RepID=A0A6J8C8L9_MYTCO|nr:PIF1 [Mytilus coruscus]
MLDEDPNIAFDLSNGHNLIISGQAGTGKSFLLKYIVKDQREKQRNVTIVCSRLQGELKTYKANDVGSDFYLRKFLAPKNLGLKVGCRVMLVRNLSDILVNGLCGTVNQLNSSVDVKFIISNTLSTVTLKSVLFTTYDPADNVFLAKRTQIPLKLAYAITVHKAQGMSLKRVVVNCEYCFKPGQIGVAVGRTEQVDGLRVRNFKKSMCRKHPSRVLDFYNNFTLGILKDDLSCCRHVIGNKGEKNDDSDSDDEDDNDDDDDSNDNTCTYAKIDDNFSSDSDFSDSEIEKLELLDCFIEKKYLNSEKYVKSVQSTISIYSKDEGTSAIYYQFMTVVLFYLERRFFEDLPSHLNLQEPESIKNIPTSDELSSLARGKIRYITGYVLAKLKHNLSIKIRNSLFAVGSESKISKLQDQMNILSSLCSSYDVLMNSSIDPESLEETKRKQKERESLTNITDVTFEFFSKHETLCRQKLSHINLVEHGKNLFMYDTDELLNDKYLIDLWVQTLTSNYNIHCASVFEGFFQSIQKGLFNFSQKRERKYQRNQKGGESFNMQFLIEDKSKNKEGSHLRLKSELMQNEKFLSENSFTKKDLLMLCLVYNVKISTLKRKEEISSELGKAILKSDCIPYPDKSDVSGTGAKPISKIIVSAAPQTMDSEVPGPSNVASTATDSLSSELQPTIQNKEKIQSNKRKTSRRGKGKGKGKSRKKIFLYLMNLITNVLCVISQILEMRIGYVVMLVLYDTTGIVQTYKMMKFGLVLVKKVLSSPAHCANRVYSQVICIFCVDLFNQPPPPKKGRG